MALHDKNKWESKYKNTPELLEDRPQSQKLEQVIQYIKKGKALDVACGSGRNTIFLANQGFNVTAIDISQTALDAINKKNHKNILTKQVDLDEYDFKENSYDLIIMTNFLDRSIIPKLKKSLKKDGVLFIETFMHHNENEKPPSNPSFLLEKEELKNFIDTQVKLLQYEEYFNEEYELYKMRKQSIVLKKI